MLVGLRVLHLKEGERDVLYSAYLTGSVLRMLLSIVAVSNPNPNPNPNPTWMLRMLLSIVSVSLLIAWTFENSASGYKAHHLLISTLKS